MIYYRKNLCALCLVTLSFLIYSQDVIVKNNGNVGIGTDSPTDVLDVGGTGRAFFGDGLGIEKKGLLIDGIAGNGAKLETYKYGTGAGGIPLYINPFGNGPVGIHMSTSPSHIFQVAGVARSTQSTWATSSDRRVKKNIRNLDAALEKIKKLHPVIFDWKDDYRAENISLKNDRYGFLAQEVKEVIPEMVSIVSETYGDKTIKDFNVLNMDALFPLFVKAIQEQQELIDKQKVEISDLKSRLERIEKLIQPPSLVETKL